MAEILSTIGSTIAKHAKASTLDPVTNLIDSNVSDVVTTIGSFIVRKVRGKFQRSITFQYGLRSWDNWQKPALFSILAKYNDFSKMSALEFTCSPDDQSLVDEKNNIRYELAEGTHNVKYRKWDLLLVVQHIQSQNSTGRFAKIMEYTLIIFDLDPAFVKAFEFDMKYYRNKLMQLKPETPTLNIFKDYHENDGYTYWDKIATVPKRHLNTIYIPYEKKKLIVDSINNFFASKQYYIDHGIPWNFKMLLHSPAGCGKSSIVKMIASEWNRNLYEANGGSYGKFIPNAITDNDPDVIHPLISISDIDRYPVLINEPIVKAEDSDRYSKREIFEMKQTYANMLNALDGISSPDGRLIILTCNDISLLSPTLIRPGRIDLIMEIGYIVPETFRQFVYDHYNVSLPDDIELSADNLTIASLNFDVVCAKLTADEFIKKYTK